MKDRTKLIFCIIIALIMVMTTLFLIGPIGEGGATATACYTTSYQPINFTKLFIQAVILTIITLTLGLGFSKLINIYHKRNKLSLGAKK